MRIAVLSETYAPNMGYAPTALPKALTRLGAEVDLVTMGLPPYYGTPDFRKTYGEFLPERATRRETTEADGYRVHFLPYGKSLGYMRMHGLFGKLRSLSPDIVQTFTTISWVPLDAALLKPLLGYKLFTGSHTTASVFPLANRDASFWDPELVRSRVTRAVPGRIVSLFAEKCYGATTDCADVAVRFFGVPRSKIDVCPLGVDTDLFFPVIGPRERESRERLRRELGFAGSDIVCIYTGRFSEDKNPLALARATDSLVREGAPFRALFVGNGVQSEAIKGCAGCVVHPFVPFHELGAFFRACDVGVWPTQESMSMLDAAACGIPIVVNDTLQAVERIAGNGITYRRNDVQDLSHALKSLGSPQERDRLGSRGAAKMAGEFSWTAIAGRRLKDYEKALAQA